MYIIIKNVMNSFIDECFEGYVISKIEEIHALKSGKIDPDYVLYVELINNITSDVKSILNKFYKEKRYIIGKTLNDKYIKDKNWEK